MLGALTSSAARLVVCPIGKFEVSALYGIESGSGFVVQRDREKSIAVDCRFIFACPFLIKIFIKKLLTIHLAIRS